MVTARGAEAGFSLLHALILLAGLGLVATIGQPFIVQAMARHEALRASDEVAAALGEARRLALGRTRAVRVVLDERNRSVSVEGGTWRKLPSGIALAGPKPDRDGRVVLLFHPDGSSDGGQVVIAGRDRAVSVLLDSSGAVRRIEAGRN